MKALNTIIISGLLAVSVNFSVSAADLETQTEEMNRVLQKQIESKISLANQEAGFDLQSKADETTEQNLFKVSLEPQLLAVSS